MPHRLLEQIGTKAKALGLRGKLIFMITAPLVLWICTALTWFGWNRVERMKESQIRTAESLIRAINQDFERLHFSQSQRISVDIVDRLSSFEDVERVWAFDGENNVFFAYNASNDSKINPLPPTGPQTEWSADYVTVCRPLTSQDSAFGYLWMDLSAAPLRASIRDVTRIVVLVGVVSILAGILVALALQVVISRPVLNLQKVARSIAKEADYNLRAERHTNDEIGELVDAFNSMLDHIQDTDKQLRHLNSVLENRVAERTSELSCTVNQLQTEIASHEYTQREREDIYKQLVEASRQAGMAQVASGVLHNVGNVLNSTGVSAEVLTAKLSASRSTILGRICDELINHGEDLGNYVSVDAQGKKLPQVLMVLHEALERERQEALAELRSLTQYLDHIKEIVAVQQSYSRAGCLREKVQLEDIIDSAVKINEAGFARHGVTIEKHFEHVPKVVTDTNKVLQILVNLISNAKYAASAIDSADRKVIIRLFCPDPDQVVIEVEDNGIGISPVHRDLLFCHGFTTRTDGHGFGLHNSAIAARELGGQITAESRGVNQGATFTVVFPVEYRTGHQEALEESEESTVTHQTSQTT